MLTIETQRKLCCIKFSITVKTRILMIVVLAV